MGIDRRNRSLVSTTRLQVRLSGSMSTRENAQASLEVLHRYDLTVAASGRTALDPKCRSLTRLPDAGEDALAEASAEGLAKPDHRRALPLTKRGRGDGRHVNVLA